MKTKRGARGIFKDGLCNLKEDKEDEENEDELFNPNLSTETEMPRKLWKQTRTKRSRKHICEREGKLKQILRVACKFDPELP